MAKSNQSRTSEKKTNIYDPFRKLRKLIKYSTLRKNKQQLLIKQCRKLIKQLKPTISKSPLETIIPYKKKGRFELRFGGNEISEIQKDKQIVIQSDKIHEVLHYLMLERRNAMIKAMSRFFIANSSISSLINSPSMKNMGISLASLNNQFKDFRQRFEQIDKQAQQFHKNQQSIQYSQLKDFIKILEILTEDILLQIEKTEPSQQLRQLQMQTQGLRNLFSHQQLRIKWWETYQRKNECIINNFDNNFMKMTTFFQPMKQQKSYHPCFSIAALYSLSQCDDRKKCSKQFVKFLTDHYQTKQKQQDEAYHTESKIMWALEEYLENRMNSQGYTKITTYILEISSTLKTCNDCLQHMNEYLQRFETQLNTKIKIIYSYITLPVLNQAQPERMKQLSYRIKVEKIQNIILESEMLPEDYFNRLNQQMSDQCIFVSGKKRFQNGKLQNYPKPKKPSVSKLNPNQHPSMIQINL